MTVRQDDGPWPHRFRSDRTTGLWRALPWLAVVSGVFFVVTVAAILLGHVAIAVCSTIAFLVCGLLVTIVAASSGTLTVGPDVVELRRWNGRRVRLPLDPQLEGLRARFLSALASPSPGPRLVLRHPARRGRIVLTEGVWARADIEAIADAVGARQTSELLDARQWHAQAPGLLRWSERHPVLVIVAWVVALVVLFVAIVELAG